MTDERLGGTWGETLMRVVLRAVAPPLEDRWTWRFWPQAGNKR